MINGEKYTPTVRLFRKNVQYVAEIEDYLKFAHIWHCHMWR